ncbi:hypothetical protein JL721_11637 [Aureococcus anophagefferens]|nr:hypothetical protein JL721_11637 [Aureococcus anophagefferens]
MAESLGSGLTAGEERAMVERLAAHTDCTRAEARGALAAAKWHEGRAAETLLPDLLYLSPKKDAAQAAKIRQVADIGRCSAEDAARALEASGWDASDALVAVALGAVAAKGADRRVEDAKVAQVVEIAAVSEAWAKLALESCRWDVSAACAFVVAGVLSRAGNGSGARAAALGRRVRRGRRRRTVARTAAVNACLRAARDAERARRRRRRRRRGRAAGASAPGRGQRAAAEAERSAEDAPRGRGRRVPPRQRGRGGAPADQEAEAEVAAPSAPVAGGGAPGEGEAARSPEVATYLQRTLQAHHRGTLGRAWAAYLRETGTGARGGRAATRRARRAARRTRARRRRR